MTLTDWTANVLFGLLGVLFPNCAGGVDDTGVAVNTVWPTDIRIECDDSLSPDLWTYEISANGDPDYAELHTVLVGDTIDEQISEIHPLNGPDYVGEQLGWAYDTSLEVVFDEDDVVLGGSTLLRCSDFASGDLAWRLNIWDTEGRLGYCAVFSTDNQNLRVFENTDSCDVLTLTSG
ncbi:MAG: hypothetical protein VX899_24080 [Myxococcota bacterium]|nr:hypothetical protein [Myxococcota bacterium]